MSDLYNDGNVVLTDDAIVLKRYYFPSFSAKHIPYSKVRGYRREVRTWRFRGRLWGTGLPGYWMPLDTGRPRRDAAFVLDIGHYTKPAITPARPDEFEAALTSRLSPT